MALIAAFAHTYVARKVVINPFKAYLFFLRGLRGTTQADFGPFHLADNIQFHARFMDWAAVQEIVFAQEYGFIRSVLNSQSSQTIIDLGANIGMFSLYALSIWPDAVVHAFEPSQRTFQILARNQLANSQLNWQIHRYAIWNADGEVCFENREFSTSSRVGDQTMGNEVVPGDQPGVTILQVHPHTCQSIENRR